MIHGKTLPNTIVSNGRDVTVSDATGAYRLPFWGTHVYCVVTPGYSPFNGSVEALTDTSKSYDLFPLQCKHPGGEFTFAQMTDCHISQPDGRGTDGAYATPDIFQKALQQLQSEANPDFVMLTGDQVEYGTLDELQSMLDVLHLAGIPAVQVIGNHEGQCPITDRITGPSADSVAPAEDEVIGNFHKHFGPARFAFFWGQYCFIILDCMSWFALDQHRWLKSLLNLIPAGTPLITAVHHPEWPFLFFPELFDHNLRLVLSGHYHTHRTFRQDGILNSSPAPALLAGPDGTPPSFRLYRIPPPGDKPITCHTINVNCAPAWRKILIQRIEHPHRKPENTPLKECWCQALDGAIKTSAPLVAEGRVVVVPYDLDDNPVGRIQVFHLETGELIWSKRLGDGFFGTPAVAAGYIPKIDEKGVFNPRIQDTGSHILAQSVTGQIYCISLASGHILWQQNLGPRAGRSCTGPMVLTEDMVLAGDSACFGAFNRHSGGVQWLWPKDALSRVGSFYTAGTAAGDRVVLVGNAYEATGVRALDVQTGECRWVWGDRARARCGDCAFSEGYFYFCGPHHVICLEAGTGTVRWTTPCDAWSHARPLVSGRRVFVATSQNRLLALDDQSGRELWSTYLGSPLLILAYSATKPSGQLAAPVSYENYVIQASSDGNLYFIDAQTGRIAWKHEFGIPLTGTPAVCENHLILTTPDATLWKFALPSYQPITGAETATSQR